MHDGNSILSFLRDYERDRQVLGIQKGRFRNDPRAAINHEALNSLRVKTKHRNESPPGQPIRLESGGLPESYAAT